MNKKLLHSIFFTIPLLLLVACQSGPKVADVTPLGSSDTGYLVEGWFNEDGSFTGTDLSTFSGNDRYKFAVTFLTGNETRGFKKGQLTIRNESKKFLSLQYRFFWYDKDGVEIPSDSTAWQPLHLSGKLTRSVSSVARRPEATHFKVFIRELKQN